MSVEVNPTHVGGTLGMVHNSRCRDARPSSDMPIRTLGQGSVGFEHAESAAATSPGRDYR